MVWSPQVRRLAREGWRRAMGCWSSAGGRVLEFAASRARPNTVRAYAHDLKAFFSVVGKEPVEVRPADVMAFVTAQRRPRPGAEKVVRISDRRVGFVDVDDPSTSGRGLGVLRVSDHPGRCGGGDEPGS